MGATGALNDPGNGLLLLCCDKWSCNRGKVVSISLGKRDAPMGMVLQRGNSSCFRACKGCVYMWC